MKYFFTMLSVDKSEEKTECEGNSLIENETLNVPHKTKPILNLLNN